MCSCEYVMIDYYREDKAQLNKLIEAVKTNFNERAEEVCYWSRTF